MMGAHQVEIVQMEIWRKEGALCRDTHNSTNPYAAGTIPSYMHGVGWLQRDLQLCLARANPRYRAEQLAFGTITREGIEGGYPFEQHTRLIFVSDIQIGAV